MNWIIAICSTEASGVKLLKFTGTLSDIKSKLLDLINSDKENDIDNWDCGSETLEDLECENDTELYGYNQYTEYHIEYTAKVAAYIPEIQ